MHLTRSIALMVRAYGHSSGIFSQANRRLRISCKTLSPRSGVARGVSTRNAAAFVDTCSELAENSPRNGGAGKSPPTRLMRTREPVERKKSSMIADAFDRLSSEQRTLLWLREVEGQSYAELATILEVPVGTVRSRLFAAREALRNVWHSERVEKGGPYEVR
jgi:RNA polymerase sigma factor (sigma-70 family)